MAYNPNNPNGQTTMSASSPVTLASDQSALSVVPQPKIVAITLSPTGSTTPAYTIGDALGAALTITSAASASGRAGEIIGAVLTDKGKLNASITMWLFKVSPTLVNADNGVFDTTDANLRTALPLGCIDFLSANYKTTNSNSLCNGVILGGPPILPFLTSGSANLFAALQINTSVTYASTTDINIDLHINQF